MIQPNLFAADTGKSAVISEDGLYRYRLTRGACHGSGTVNFIMLNPSTADGVKDDPTIRRLISFARSAGWADLVVTNLFAFRSPDPKAMKAAVDPVGPENDRYILEAAREASAVFCAWGAHGSYRGRSATVRAMLERENIKMFCLVQLDSGEPGHPLYLPSPLTQKPLEAF